MRVFLGVIAAAFFGNMYYHVLSKPETVLSLNPGGFWEQWGPRSVYCLLLAFGAGGSSGAGGLVIWPLFGSTNQILAALTLLIISVLLLKLGRPVRYTFIPMIFVLLMAFWAGVVKLIDFYRDGNMLLVAIDFIVLVTSVLVMLEAASAMRDYRQQSLARES